MKTIAIITGKIIVLLGKILHRGSSLPGKIALKIDHNLLKKLTYPEIRIAVTGSSGKGSTSKLIAKSLKDNGYTICFNNSGSNLSWGITTSLLQKMNLRGKITTKVLIIEIDERYAKDVFKYILPTHIIITNITKDQPPRQHHVDIIYKELLESINKEANLILNMDDPYLRKFEKDTNNSITYYALDKTKYSYQNQLFENLNLYHCPYCHTLLNYDYYHFETLGKYNCPKCDFKWTTPDILGENLNLENQTLTINKKNVPIGGDMLFNAYNILASITLLHTLNIPEDKTIESVTKHCSTLNFEFITKNKTFKALDCKAENATTYNACVLKIYQDKRPKDIIIGWKEISRRYNHFDVSWLYDIAFELLNNETLNKIYACGIDAENIKKRLLLSNIPEEKIVTASNLDNIKDEVMNSKVNIVYGILNFDYLEPFTKTFKEDQI